MGAEIFTKMVVVGIDHITIGTDIYQDFVFKCSDKTSYPIIQDPRIGKLMNDLPQLNEKN